MAKRKVVRKSKSTKTKSAASKPKTAVQQALEVTWVLKGHLKNAQISYLRVGAMLRRVRDEKLYSALGHADIESYAEARLHLGRTSLYRYLKVYDWVSVNHKEWLEPKPKGFIPDLSDVADLIWIEQKLEEKNLNAKTRAALEELKKKALAGELKKRDLSGLRKRGKTEGEDGLKTILSQLRSVRRRGAQLASMPPEVISGLDGLIETLKNAITVHVAGLHIIGPEKGGALARFSSAVTSYQAIG